MFPVNGLQRFIRREVLLHIRRPASVLLMKRAKNSGVPATRATSFEGSVNPKKVKTRSKDELAGKFRDLEESERGKEERLNLKGLREWSSDKKNKEEAKSAVRRVGGKIRAVVDMKMMKEELRQLEDPPLSPVARELTSKRLGFSFFDTPCEQLAQNLLGKVLVRRLENGDLMKGRIVETEGYLGVIDKASHSYQNKVTARNVPMFMPPGTIYVYMTYGMYHCFNLSSQGEGCAVLIRALEPLEGVEHMAAGRSSKAKSKGKELKTHELCNGPSKLCMALRLDKTHSKYSICTWKGLWVEESDRVEDMKVVKCARIGIDGYGAEWSMKPLRYYIYGNKYVSKRNKSAEASLGLD